MAEGDDRNPDEQPESEAPELHGSNSEEPLASELEASEEPSPAGEPEAESDPTPESREGEAAAESEVTEQPTDVFSDIPDIGGDSPEPAETAESEVSVSSSEDQSEPSSSGESISMDSEEDIRRELGLGGGKIEIDQDTIDRMLSEAVVGYDQIFAGTALGSDGEIPASGEIPPELQGGGDMLSQNLSLLRDVNMKVKVELGRGKMYLKDILRLAQGSVVELERLAGDPLDIYVNEKVIARGEVLVLNENFCIRITEIYSPEEAILSQ